MERIGDDVRLELRRFGPAGALGEIVQAWPAAVGDVIAANAWPARVARDGTLHVATSSSAWAFELTQLAAAIREGLGRTLGKDTPTGLRFAPGRLPERGIAEQAERATRHPQPRAEEQERAAEVASAIEDDELRALVARAAAASLASARSDRAL
jgi:hypothetical protein